MPVSISPPRLLFACGFSRQTDDETMAIHLRHNVHVTINVRLFPLHNAARLAHEYIQRRRTISWEPCMSFVLNIMETWRAESRLGCFLDVCFNMKSAARASGSFQSSLYGTVKSTSIMVYFQDKIWSYSIGKLVCAGVSVCYFASDAAVHKHNTQDGT